jgi:asparagine synthase (glutamine-hydrolysing)
MPAIEPVSVPIGIQMMSIERRWMEHRTGQADHRMFLWSWLTLQQIFSAERLGVAASVG